MQDLHEDRAELPQTNMHIGKKIEQLLSSAFRMFNSDPDTSLQTILSALGMAEQAGSWSNQLYCRLALILYYDTIGESEQQAKVQEEATKFRLTLPASEAIQGLINFGRSCSSFGRNDFAVEYFTLALELATTPDTSSYRATTLNQLGICEARTGDNGKALDYLNQALELTYQNEDMNLRALVWNNIGNVYRLQSDMPQALEYYSKALFVARQQESNKLTAMCLNSIGIIYALLGEYADALEYFLRCETLQQDGQADSKIYSNTLNNIGNLYEKLFNYDKALEYYQKSIALRQLYNDSYLEADSLHNMGIIYQLQGVYDQAYTHYRQSLELRMSIGDKKGTALSLNGLGQVLTLMGNMDEAMDYHMRSIALADEIENRIDKVYFLINISETLIKRSEIAPAFEYLNTALAIAEETGSMVQRREAHHTLSEAYRNAGNAEAALEHYIRFHDLDKEIFNALNSQKVRNLQTLHQVEQTRKEAEIYRLKNVELASALTNFEQANNRLTILNNEKNELLNIVAHDLKNPLSSVMMLADILMKDETITIDEVREFSGDILASSERMFTLITNLLEVNALEKQIDEGIELNALDVVSLLRYITRQYIPQAEKKNITLRQKYSAENLVAFSEQEALMQVLDNLVSNAVKFSPQGKSVTISASSVMVDDSRSAIRIEIQDEGPGLSLEDQSKLFKKFTRLSAQPTGGEHSTGLGLSIVKRQIELLHGLVWCESEPGHGAKFIVQLPVEADSPTATT